MLRDSKSTDGSPKQLVSGRARFGVQALEAGYIVERMQALESGLLLFEYQLPSFIAF